MRQLKRASSKCYVRVGHDEVKLVEVEGRDLMLKEAGYLDLFIHHPLDEFLEEIEDLWSVSEGQTGGFLVEGAPSMYEAVHMAEVYIKERGYRQILKTLQLIVDGVDALQISPRYKILPETEAPRKYVGKSYLM